MSEIERQLSKAINTSTFNNPKTAELFKHRSNPAKWTYERLRSMIFDFEQSLSDNEEIGCRLVSFGNNATYYIENIGCWGPDIIIFYCIETSSQNKATLIQNVSQLNVLLLRLPKLPQEHEPRRIGFKS